MEEPKTKLDNFNPLLQLPNHALFVGASQSGKTHLCFNLISNPNLFDPKPVRILFFYDQFQEKYIEAKERLASDEGIELLLYKGFPSITLDDIEKLDGQTIMVVDDFSEQASSSKELARIATNGRHKNLSLWVMLHSLFNKSPESRTICQNVRWFFFLPSLRLESQLRTFGSQLGLKECILYAFRKCQEESDRDNRYIIVDTGPLTPRIMRIRSNIHNLEKQFCYSD